MQVLSKLTQCAAKRKYCAGVPSSLRGRAGAQLRGNIAPANARSRNKHLLYSLQYFSIYFSPLPINFNHVPINFSHYRSNLVLCRPILVMYRSNLILCLSILVVYQPKVVVSINFIKKARYRMNFLKILTLNFFQALFLYYKIT